METHAQNGGTARKDSERKERGEDGAFIALFLRAFPNYLNVFIEHASCSKIG